MTLHALRPSRRYWRSVITVLAFIIIFCLFQVTRRFDEASEAWHGAIPPQAIKASPWSKLQDRQLHLLVPATSSNTYFCRLLLSAAATGYPPPTLLMWGGEEFENPYKTHMNKVQAIYDHLNAFSSDHDDDLVLVLDGYDIWLQLGPDVLLKRYYDIIDAENKRLRKRLGWRSMLNRNIYNSVVFGPDKICWPEDASRTACWAVPESPLPRYAFGPQTDSGQWREGFRPRWLNSGTILGPIKDVREVVLATLNRIQTNRTVDSDQYYFANLWGEQEYARKEIARELPPKPFEIWFQDEFSQEGKYVLVQPQIPQLPKRHNSELHIVIDYWSQIFQTNAFYFPFLTWSTFNGSNSTSKLHGSGWGLPTDIEESHMGLSSLPRNESAGSSSWHNMPLITNLATLQVPALIHFTPPKDVQDIWWPRMWFYGQAQKIIYEASAQLGDAIITTTADGEIWRPYVPHIHDDQLDSELMWMPGGGFTSGSSAQFLGWHRLCGAFEDRVFNNSLVYA